MARIIHILGDSEFGGASRIVLALAERQIGSGHLVHILTTNPQLSAHGERIGATIVDLDVIRRPVRPAFDLQGIWNLYRWLKQHPYDAVHTHTSKAGFSGRLAARAAGMPLILHTLHGFAFAEAASRSTIRAAAFLERLAARCSTCTITVSHYHRIAATALGIDRSERIHAIPNGVSPERVRGRCEVLELKESLRLKPNDLLVLCPSRLAPGKGLFDLLGAAERVCATRRDIYFAIAGDGPLRQELELAVARSPAAHHLVLLGFQRHIGDLLQAADIVALPSEREGMSITLLESMAAGRPIITTNVTSAAEVTDDGRVAQLVPVKNADALAAAVVDLCSDPVQREWLGRSAADRYRSHYTEEQMLDAYAALYRSLGIPMATRQS